MGDYAVRDAMVKDVFGGDLVVNSPDYGMFRVPLNEVSDDSPVWRLGEVGTLLVSQRFARSKGWRARKGPATAVKKVPRAPIELWAKPGDPPQRRYVRLVEVAPAPAEVGPLEEPEAPPAPAPEPLWYPVRCVRCVGLYQVRVRAASEPTCVFRYCPYCGMRLRRAYAHDLKKLSKGPYVEGVPSSVDVLEPFNARPAKYKREG